MNQRQITFLLTRIPPNRIQTQGKHSLGHARMRESRISPFMTYATLSLLDYGRRVLTQLLDGISWGIAQCK
jgi:hypothetical protein